MPPELNLRIAPVENIIFEGMVSRFQRLLGFPFAWTTASDDVQVVARLFGNNKIQYPYGILKLKSWAESEERGSVHSATRRGRMCVITTDKKRYFKVHFMPMDFVFEATVVASSFASVLKSANSISFGRRNGWFKFTAQYGGQPFDIGVLPESTISFPDPPSDNDSAKEYRLTVNVDCKGFISYPELVEGMMIDNIDAAFVLGETSPEIVFQTSSEKPTTTVSLPVSSSER